MYGEENNMSDKTKKSNPLVLPVENISDEVVDQALKSIDKKEEIGSAPMNYIPIRLDSNGRLSAPKVLHFRDYSADEALMLDVYEEKEQLNAIVDIYSQMNHEGFDAGELHIKELLQILFTLHGNYISPKVEKEYYLDEDLPEGDGEGCKNNKNNIASQEIPIKLLKSKSIDKTKDGKKVSQPFKEPYKIHDNKSGQDIYLQFSRVKHMIKAYDFCDEIFHDELREFSSIKREIRSIYRIKDIEARKKAFEKFESENYDEWQSFRKFTKKYDHLYTKALQAQTIIKVNDKEITDLKEQLNVIKEISLGVWGVNNNVSELYDFGIEPEVTFMSEALGKKVTRRFQFRVLDFLPTVDKPDNDRFSVSFD